MQCNLQSADRFDALHEAGISILPSRPRENIRPIARLAIFFAFVSTAKTLSCSAGPLPRPKSRDLLDLESISQTSPRHLPYVVQISFASFPSAYPAGSGKPCIRRRMLQNKRRVRWLSASNSQ